MKSKFNRNPKKVEIFNCLISGQTRFTVDQVEFEEPLITGCQKEREARCKKRAEQLYKIAFC